MIQNAGTILSMPRGPKLVRTASATAAKRTPSDDDSVAHPGYTSRDLGSRQVFGEDEKFKRLRVFLEAKLKGVKYSTFQALHREYIDIKKKEMLNNERAKKVGKYLEMVARGLTGRQFSAFKRHLWMIRTTSLLTLRTFHMLLMS